MNELHLFAGAGGGILGGLLLGHTPICAVEIEPYCRKVLFQRQRDGILPWFPIWDDVRTFNGKPWRGIADVVCGGFPCQDISLSKSVGTKGISGERSGLWFEMFRIVCEVRPRFVFVENSPALTSRGMGTVLGNLASMGYDAEWGVLGAHHTGGYIKRERMWIVAFPTGNRLEGWNSKTAEQNRKAKNAPISPLDDHCAWLDVSNPRAYGSSNGVADRKHRLAAIGNGQVPAVVRKAWHVLCQRVGSKKG